MKMKRFIDIYILMAKLNPVTAYSMIIAEQASKRKVNY